jgi:hypothetical protein
MSDNRFVQIKFENFHLAMEARIWQRVTTLDGTKDFTTYHVMFHPGIGGSRWSHHVALTFHDAMTLVTDLSVSTRREFPAA